MYVDHWPVSAMNHDTINEYNLTMILASFATSRLRSGDLNSLTKVSSLSAVVMNRVMFQEDLAKLELALRSAVAQVLQRTGEPVNQMHETSLVGKFQVYACQKMDLLLFTNFYQVYYLRACLICVACVGVLTIMSVYVCVYT